MGKAGTVYKNKKSYRYALPLIDVFSRFVWLRAVRKKSSKIISEELVRKVLPRTWDDYLLDMVQNQTFGDQQTLYAAVNFYFPLGLGLNTHLAPL